MSILGTTGTRLTVATSLALTIAFGSSGFAASGPTSGKDAKEKGLEFQKGYAPVNGLRILLRNSWLPTPPSGMANTRSLQIHCRGHGSQHDGRQSNARLAQRIPAACRLRRRTNANTCPADMPCCDRRDRAGAGEAADFAQ
jgi:hypothetical protein